MVAKSKRCTSYSPENYRLGWNSDLTSAEKSVRDRVENSTPSSQVSHRAEHHVEESSESVMSKRAQESKAKEGPAVAKPRPMSLVSRNLLSAKKNLSARFKCFEHSGESRVGSEFCFMERQETGAKQQPRPNSTFSRVATR